MLHLAVMQGLSSIVNLLLRHCSNRNCQDNEGDTPLHLAFRYGFKTCISALLAAECDEQIENKQGRRPAEL